MGSDRAYKVVAFIVIVQLAENRENRRVGMVIVVNRIVQYKIDEMR